MCHIFLVFSFFFQAEDGIRDLTVTGVQTCAVPVCFFFSSRRRHTRFDCDWSSDVCSSDLQHDPHTGVATITLNRPDRLNALTFDVYRELRDAFRTLDGEPGVRAVIITGAGRAFCSGGDVEDIIGALFARDAAGLLEFTRLTCDLILALRQCRRPIVGALNGTVAGAGAVIAAACDMRIAAESAKIAFLFTKVGLSGACRT